jgi:hypothetical protein
MRRTWMRLLVVLATLIPATAHAGWFGGPNFGFTHISPDQGNTASLFGWGGSSGVIGAWQPGLRVGGVLPTGQDEIFTDTSLEYIGSNGQSATAMQFSLNYQRDFFKPKTSGAYINGGVGVLSLSATGSTPTTLAVFGGGLGYAQSIVQGHGRFRLEGRLDRQAEDKSKGLVALNLYSIRLGFDLMQ